MFKQFIKELFIDLLKQACAAVIWSSLVCIGHGIYSYVTNKVDHTCEYTKWWHYHPARVLVCKILENNESKH